MRGLVECLCGTPETNVTLCINYTGINLKKCLCFINPISSSRTYIYLTDGGVGEIGCWKS